MKAVCPACRIDCKNATNLAAHLNARHPEYLAPDKKKPGPTRKYATDAEAYEAQKAHALAASARKSLTGRELGPIPEVVDPGRRERCSTSLLEHCRTYHPRKFYLPFSKTHYRAIEKAERCVLQGGQFAVAMPRGSGKSEICKRAAEWAILNAHRRFVVLVGATDDEGASLLADIKNQLLTNNLLAEDYPEACYPVRKIGGMPQKAGNQLYCGQPTHLNWSADRITLAHLPGSVCAGATLLGAGITSAIRGKNVPAPDGGTLRPDLCIIDDPQTRKSATSITLIQERISIIDGDITYLAGPDTRMACLLPCTVIAPHDLADQFLDRTTHPEWQGERTKLVESFPANMSLWEDYFKLLAEDQRAEGDGSPAREFYVANRVAMDEGAALSWPERYDTKSFVSALEQAMVLWRKNPATFQAEMQNEPMLSTEIAAGSLKLSELREKSNKLPRRTVPREATHLTVGIDVHKEILYFTVAAWTDGAQMGGAVIDYGAYPRQNRDRFTQDDARPSLSDVYPQMDADARLHAGLMALVTQVAGQPYPREGGGELSVGRVLVDSGYQTPVVKRAARMHPLSSLIYPSHGIGITAKQPPMGMRQRKDRTVVRRGKCWMQNAERLVTLDTNFWKSFVARRLRLPVASLGCLYLPGGDNSHYSEHLVSEYMTPMLAESTGRRVEEWQKRPNDPQNHWWDTLVYAAVAASHLGLKFDAAAIAAAAPAVPAAQGEGGAAVPAAYQPTTPQKPKKPRRSFGDMLRERQTQGAYPWTR